MTTIIDSSNSLADKAITGGGTQATSATARTEYANTTSPTVSSTLGHSSQLSSQC